MHAFTMQEAASLLGVSTATVRRLADSGTLVTRRSAGGRRKVDGRSLAAHLAGEDVKTPRGGSSSQSMRNRLSGIVTRVVKDKVAAQVEIQVGRHRVVSLLTREAVDALGLEPGMPAIATIKATNVSVELAPSSPRGRS
jgi:molybdopterin-binding protein